MKLVGEFFKARLTERANKYLAYIKLDDTHEEFKAHVPDPGRLKELLYPDAEVVVRKEEKAGRKTPYTIVGVKTGKIWVNIQSILTNKLFEEEYKKIPFFKDYEILRREYTYGNSRFDFLLENQITKEQAFLEVKSSTLVKEGRALFPDAPTTRGAKHVKELTKALEEGYGSIIVFVIKREDASSLSPHVTIDPVFAEHLRNAIEKGVKALAVKCSYDPIEKYELEIEKEVPVLL
ncbi:MAG: DNA/RNA nuclease SfsA [Candidatus Heimdallarchaeota archaeon]|nr:DNA/RNA nuclease SfsA [Candidatus Heimdallarchaeota archaeon]